LAAGGPLLCSHKVTKGLSADRLLCAQGFCPANKAEPRAAIILPYFIRSFPCASAKTSYAPATAQSTIVLPAFARSLSADGEGKGCFNQ